jgi:hypothetical protein
VADRFAQACSRIIGERNEAMKHEQPLEVAYALVFAICVLAALVLLASCGTNQAVTPDPRPAVRAQSSRPRRFPRLACADVSP